MMTAEDTEQLKQDLQVADCPQCCLETFHCLPKKDWRSSLPLWRCSECGYEEDRFEQVNWDALVRLLDQGLSDMMLGVNNHGDIEGEGD